MPKYKHKERGRNVVISPSNALSKPALNKGIIKLSTSSIESPTFVNNINQVRIVPKLNCYVIEVVYTVCDVEQKQSNYVAVIDLGLTNLMAITSNQPDIKPLLVNGRPLKSINQNFNNKLAKAQSNKSLATNKGT
ncbi:MAG: hypothetical protein F6K54_01795 [Okeania sp. SIO3B5]|uniref:hypothetical protein n=1 Tax=Okeania sp. SIO3B5 TaxID=2607811 RepID=UPI0013FF1F10|nr:hypothetical protein [Okeania sp. SIO3B5]NEO51931.1 hypothetical protein [Okeania sp. SIO3B5]